MAFKGPNNKVNWGIESDGLVIGRDGLWSIARLGLARGVCAKRVANRWFISYSGLDGSCQLSSYCRQCARRAAAGTSSVKQPGADMERP